MKKYVLFILLSLFSLGSFSQHIEKEGKTFFVTKVTSRKEIKTDYFYADSSGKYSIYINPSSGKCYVYKTSKKTGKQYKKYLPEEINIALSKEYNIPYKTTKKEK